jgi:DNA-binding FadR family transcriptional regulator
LIDRSSGASATTGRAEIGTRASAVVDSVEAEIRALGWPAGLPLGGPQALADRFGVSPAVARQAARLVEHRRLARMQRGPNGGLIACPPSLAPVVRVVVMNLQATGTSLAELTEARLRLGTFAVEAAARHLDEPGLDRLRSFIDSESRVPPPAIWARPDFLSVFSEVGQNPALSACIEVVHRVSGRYLRAVQQRWPDGCYPVTRRSRRDRARIADAIIAGDVSTARQMTRRRVLDSATWLRSQGGDTSNFPIPPDLYTTLAEQTAARIWRSVVEHRLAAGTSLGSERELAGEYAVGLDALREAVRILEMDRVVEIRRGRGGGVFTLTPDPLSALPVLLNVLDFRGARADHIEIVARLLEPAPPGGPPTPSILVLLHQLSIAALAERNRRLTTGLHRRSFP